MNATMTTDSDKPDECVILDGMTSLVPAAISGALVSLRDLRRRLARELPGRTFDAAVLGLNPEWFALHRGDPTVSRPDELSELVEDDEHGGHFIGIALR